MLRNLNQSSGGKRILGVPQVGILAAQIASETATGDHGPGILYNESQQAGYAGKYLRARITSWPATGTLFVAENGQVTATGLPNGLYTIGYDLDVDGAYDSSSTFEIAVGVVDATADGATLTGTASLEAGNASGEQNATAPGATLTGTSSLEAGTAAGEQNATAPGATLTGTSTLEPGTAAGGSGGTDATADGATLTGTSSLEPGIAVGDLDAAAPGASLTGDSSLQPGAATNGSSLAPGPDRYRIRASARLARVVASRNYTVKK